MSEAAANVAIAWMAGKLLGVGAVTGAAEMIIAGSILTLLSLYYYHRFVKPQENEHDL